MKTIITCSECGMTYDSDKEYHYGNCSRQKFEEKKECLPGSKYDTGKLRYDLFPPECEEAIVEILTLGAKKYADSNWVQVPEPEKRYYAALRRHLEAWRKGEREDSEWGKLHLSHAATCMIFLLWFDLQKDKEKNKDESGPE